MKRLQRTHLSPLLLATPLTLLTFLFTLPAFAQMQWQRNYGGAGAEHCYSAQQTSDGGYIATGTAASFGNGIQVYLIKTNAYGDTLWTRTYGGGGDDGGFSVQLTPQDTGYIIVGYSNSFGNSHQAYLVKTNVSGDTLWTRTYGGSGIDWGNSVQPTQDGGYVIAGYTESFGNGAQVYLVKTNSAGAVLWTKAFGGTGTEEGFSVQQTQDLGYIVAGTNNSVGNQAWLVKTNASGDTVWSRTYGGSSYEYGRSVQQTPDGGYILAGTTFSYGPGAPNYSNFFLVKTNASGDTSWTRPYGGTNNEEGFSVSRTQDGSYIVTGFTRSYGNGAQVYLVKANASGDTLWTRTYGGTANEEGNSVRQTLDLGYLVGGSSYSFGNGWQAYLIKTDPQGRSSGIETERGQGVEGPRVQGFKINPNPFASYFQVPGHEAERFSLFDISGRKVGTYKGDRIGEGLGAGVYFLRPSEGLGTPIRLVKIR